MRRTVAIDIGEVMPQADAVLRCLKVPDRITEDARFQRLLSAGFDILAARGAPAGLFYEVEKEEFGYVYQGAGRNEKDTPLQAIYPRATGLALFAVTMGRDVSREIDYLFRVREFALAAMLDAAASEAAELAAAVVEKQVAEALCNRGLFRWETRLLRYSPGYCGWHLSGQRALFDALRPDEIGITLRESFLMEPLKSVTGVIVAGPATIHEFDDVYPFCGTCETHVCRERIRKVLSC